MAKKLRLRVRTFSAEMPWRDRGSDVFKGIHFQKNEILLWLLDSKNVINSGLKVSKI